MRTQEDKDYLLERQPMKRAGLLLSHRPERWLNPASARNVWSNEGQPPRYSAW